MSSDRKTGTIYWGLLIILVLGTLVLDPVWFFVCSAVYLFYIIFRNRFKMKLPKILGMNEYIFIIIMNFIIGYVLYSFRDVARDFFYFSSTLIWIYIGANYTKKGQFSMDSFYKTICVYALAVSTCCFLYFIFFQSWTFTGVRYTFVKGVYDIGFILPIMVLNIIFNNNYVFSKKIDNFIIVILCVHIFMSIGRVSILVPMFSVIVVLFMGKIYKENSKASFTKILTLIVVLMIIAIVVLLIIPKDILVFMKEKILETFQEIDSSQVIDSTEVAMNNWRGYEMQVAIEQWKNSSIWQQIFGSGLGKGIHIDYVPYSWENMVEKNEIPLLHNGFCTALIKTGLLGMLSLIFVFVGTACKSLKNLKRNVGNVDVNIILTVMSVGGLIYTYIANGPIAQGAFLIWGLLMGVLNTKSSTELT